MEYFKKDYKEWSESSDSKISDYIVKQPRKLRTIPQAHGKEIPAVLAELKAALPDISPKEVRRFYMPYHEAILLELDEEGYPEAFRYMNEILKLDEKIAAKTPGMLTWKKPRLKDDKDLINYLRDGLVTAEQGKTLGDYVLRAMSFLDTALFFQMKTWEWWWIAERLYESALGAAENIEHDDNQTVTLIRYLYGRFLFNELQNPREAIDYLEKASEDSEDKTWNASKKLGVKQKSIFKESNMLLYKALLILARKERQTDPERALEFCTEALQRATDAGNAEYVNETLYELGKCHVAVNDFKNALQSFSKLLALAKRTQDVEGVCHAHMELAFTYKQLNDNDYTEKHLRMWRNNAENFGLLENLADAHYYTGEHYLSQGKLHLSTNHLETALNLYNRLDATRDADRARCIAGISKGQEIIEKYIDIVLRCGDYDPAATLKLCRWKSSREPFWTEEIYDIKSELEIHYENSGTFSTTSHTTPVNDQAIPRA